MGTILISGITASGKTTLGKRLCKRLEDNGIKNVKLLDGEDIRTALKKRGAKFGYSVKDRIALVKEYVKIAKSYNNEGNIVIMCTIASSKDSRSFIRKELIKFMEVYLDCPLDECIRRDYKGHYKKALNGEYETFIGITDPYEISDNPELILNTSKMGIDECSDILHQNVILFLKRHNLF